VYLRHSRVEKDGKSHVYWRLVRSVRQGRRVVQQTVAQLGELDALGQARARALAREITGSAQDAGQAELFANPCAAESVPVRIDRVRLERSRSFGSVWLGRELWRALRLDRVIEELVPRGRAGVAWADVIAVLVIGRLCEPSSELHVAERWYRTTALEDLFGIAPERMHEERLYRALDRVLPHKQAIEKHLVERLGELFRIDYDLLLYDVTSTYFEGQGAPSIAKRGYSRDHRPECVQVNIAMVVTREGIPLGYEIFAGNTTDATTVEEIVETMEERYGKAKRVWVMDRGMTSAENIAWLQQTGRRYVIGTPKSELRCWARELAEASHWQRIRDDLEVKICQGPEGTESFVLCRSAARQEKEKAMHQRFARRIEQGLERLAGRLSRAKRAIDRGRVERQIGRLLERNSRAAARFAIEVSDDPSTAAGIKLSWEVLSEWEDWAQLSEGAYVLRTNVTDWNAEELWKTYVQLTEAEAAFRIHKSDLCIRPIWHRKAGRIQAHILICFLAYVLWKTLQKWQSRAGLGDTPRNILTELARIHAADVVLALADGSRREMRIRCVVQPDTEQAILLQRLGLRLPQRLAPPNLKEM
jgi:transposase